MVLLGLEILVGSYIGTRVFKHFKAKKNQPKPKSGHLKPNQKATQITSLNVTTTEKETDHYLKASTVSVGLVVGGYFYPPIKLLGILSTSYATVPILVETQKSLSEVKLKNDLLISIVSVGCIAMGQYFTASLAAWFYQLGNKMVEKTQNHSEEILINIFGQQPKNTWILKDDVEIEVPLETVQLNDIVVVDMGEVIPIDGEIIKGMAMIDQHVLTGESMPVEKGVGEQVFASTIILSGLGKSFCVMIFKKMTF
jgi:cation transport ATPase